MNVYLILVFLLLFQTQVDHPADSFVQSVCEEDLATLFNLLDKQRQGIEVLADVLA